MKYGSVSALPDMHTVVRVIEQLVFTGNVHLSLTLQTKKHQFNEKENNPESMDLVLISLFFFKVQSLLLYAFISKLDTCTSYLSVKNIPLLESLQMAIKFSFCCINRFGGGTVTGLLEK